MTFVHPQALRRKTIQELRARMELLSRVSNWLELPLAALALVMLALLVLDFAVDVEEPWSTRVRQAEVTIWVVFLLAFVLEFLLAPSKLRYLRKNWITAIAVALPALRVLRIARAVRILRASRAIRGISLVRVFTTLNRATRSLSRFSEVSQFGYLVGLAVIVALTAAAATFSFERGHADAEIRSYGGALWWAATTITTVSAPLETVSVEGRIIGVALRLFGLAVVGYFTASIAVFLLGGPSRQQGVSADEVRELRREMTALRRALEGGPRSLVGGPSGSGPAPDRALGRRGAAPPGASGRP